MKKNLGIFLFFLLLFGCCLKAAAQTPVKSKRVKIYAEKGWQDSGIELKITQFYEIRAWGSWVSGYEVPLQGPEGAGFGNLFNGALLGWIAEEKPAKLGYDSVKRDVIPNIIYFGRGGRYKSGSNGKLWFSMGEWSGCKECSGEIEVLIIIYE